MCHWRGRLRASAAMRPIHVIGGGLAGSEAAWQAAVAGVPVLLHEIRLLAATAAHRAGRLAELVCSNSFRSDDAATNAVGVLHREMRALGSIIMPQPTRSRRWRESRSRSTARGFPRRSFPIQS